MTVDLVGRQVRAEGVTADFELDENARWRLLEGLDDISLTLREESSIVDYEANRPSFAAYYRGLTSGFMAQSYIAYDAPPVQLAGGASAC